MSQPQQNDQKSADGSVITLFTLSCRGLPGVPARIAGHEPVTAAATATADGTSANGVDAQDTRQPAAAAEPVTGPLQRGKQLKKQKAPHEGSSTRARGSAVSEPSGSSDALSLVQNFGTVMSGWGATMDEGIKAIMSGGGLERGEGQLVFRTV